MFLLIHFFSMRFDNVYLFFQYSLNLIRILIKSYSFIQLFCRIFTNRLIFTYNNWLNCSFCKFLKFRNMTFKFLDICIYFSFQFIFKRIEFGYYLIQTNVKIFIKLGWIIRNRFYRYVFYIFNFIIQIFLKFANLNSLMGMTWRM